METNNILQADVLDIIFDGRNKDYGAYQLRKNYNRRLARAMAVMFGVCLLAVVGSVLASSEKKVKTQLIVQTEVNLARLDEKKPDPIPEQPKPKPVEKLETIKSTPPRIVQEEVKEPPPTQDQQDNVQIADFNQKGVVGDVVAPPVEEKSTGPVTAPAPIEDYNKEFRTVAVQAQFPGGPAAWQKFLERTLKQDVPVDNGAPPGDYPVVVSFLVDRDGNVTEVKAETDPGYGTAAEAVRVIQRSGKWVPAIQNGRNVIFRQKQSIIFRVTDG